MTATPGPPKPKAARKAKAPSKPDSAAAGERTCEFCGQAFARASTVLSHLCERKRRFLARDDKHVKMAFIAFTRFYERGMRARQSPSFEMFAASPYYLGFVKFGRMLFDNNVINPLGFIDFLIRAEVALEKWVSPALYELFIRELSKSETAFAAMERNVMLMQQWAIESGEHWSAFFRKVAPAQATLWIKSGRISPWVLFTAASAEALFARLSPEQSEIVGGCIDPDFWDLKLARHSEDVAQIRAILRDAGV